MSGVYFIRDGSARIKIGYSCDPIQRLTALQSAHADVLILLAVTPGSQKLERRLQRRFAHSHIVREWYRPTPDLLEFIATLPPLLHMVAQKKGTLLDTCWSRGVLSLWVSVQGM